MSDRLHLGISTCPNDTFTFHALLAGEVDRRGLELEIELADVQELNARLAAGEFDAAKASFYAALRGARELVVLRSGAALGFGVGPVLLAREPGPLPPPGTEPAPRVLCPGEGTTAHLLFRLLHPGVGRVEQVVFSDIMPALCAGQAQFGVCIHEGRFTWRDRGLHLVEDLGASWETRTGGPLPLGGILGRRTTGRERLQRLEAAIADSIDWARANPERALPTMRRYAQEQEDAALWQHVELYVNQWTRELGEVGTEALRALAREARAAGLLAEGAELEVLAG